MNEFVVQVHLSFTSVVPSSMQRTLYIIATTSRSGSTHLCRMLTSTRRLGEPAEYYNVRVKPERMETWNAKSDIEYFQQML